MCSRWTRGIQSVYLTLLLATQPSFFPPAKHPGCCQLQEFKVSFNCLSPICYTHWAGNMEASSHCRGPGEKPIKPSANRYNEDLSTEQSGSWSEHCSMDAVHFLFVSLLPALSQLNDPQYVTQAVLTDLLKLLTHLDRELITELCWPV